MAGLAFPTNCFLSAGHPSDPGGWEQPCEILHRDHLPRGQIRDPVTLAEGKQQAKAEAGYVERELQPSASGNVDICLPADISQVPTTQAGRDCLLLWQRCPTLAGNFSLHPTPPFLPQRVPQNGSRCSGKEIATSSLPFPVLCWPCQPI